jgi:KDO2-lipid IV(A) lauroyltransferase
MIKRLIDYFVYLFVRILFCAAQSLSLEAGHLLAKGLARLFTNVIPVRRRLLHENLQLAFPEKTTAERRQLILTMWEHLFLMGIEIALSGRRIRDMNWTDHIQLVGVSPLLCLLHQDRPVIIVTGHFGNFELGGFSLGILTYPSNSVARDLDNPFLDNFIRRFRESTGQFLISKNGGSSKILRVLNNNGLMAFLADQSAGAKGCKVNFFGKPASTFKAIALLSIQFKAPIVVCYALRQKDKQGNFLPMKFTMRITGILDPLHLPPEIQNVKEITQWFTQKLEEGIRQYPEQYWWLHRRWKE